MISAPLRRPRASSRLLGALAAVLLLLGQTALIAHHHDARPSNGGRAAISRQDASGLEANCQLCSLSTQSRASHVAAAPPAASGLAAQPAPVFPSAVLADRVRALLPSSRAPPAA